MTKVATFSDNLSAKILIEIDFKCFQFPTRKILLVAEETHSFNNFPWIIPRFVFWSIESSFSVLSVFIALVFVSIGKIDDWGQKSMIPSFLRTLCTSQTSSSRSIWISIDLHFLKRNCQHNSSLFFHRLSLGWCLRLKEGFYFRFWWWNWDFPFRSNL